MRKIITLLAVICCVAMHASDGALSGRFTINKDGSQVVFAKGNLQYQPETEKWQFAESQANVLGTANENIVVPTYSGWIDLFGWGTGINPLNASTDWQDYPSFTEWGANAILNGGNRTEQWRTMTADEWSYLFFGRTNASTLFGLGCVNGQNGTILLPDNWVTPDGVTFKASTQQGLTKKNDYYANTDGKNFQHNTYTADKWALMEAAGAVFLPAAGYRWDNEVQIDDNDLGSMGYYWASTPVDNWKANCLYFDAYELSPTNDNSRIHGHAVRLVQTPSDEPTTASSTRQQPQIVKQLIDGQLMILLPGGKRLDVTGRQL